MLLRLLVLWGLDTGLPVPAQLGCRGRSRLTHTQLLLLGVRMVANWRFPVASPKSESSPELPAVTVGSRLLLRLSKPAFSHL